MYSIEGGGGGGGGEISGICSAEFDNVHYVLKQRVWNVLSCFYKELCHLFGRHGLYFKLLLFAYQAIACARKHIGVKYKVNK